MSKILGLDLGTNSIGWGVIDGESIIDIGVRIFPEGVENLGEGENEMSRNASRRGARQIRRQYLRRKLRKLMLLNELNRNGMCPIEKNEIQTWADTGKFPETPAIREWFKPNPYHLRSLAVSKPLSLHELGRIFYHLAQRRGFLSNSKSAAKDEGKIFEGEAKEGKTGINQTLNEIAGKTLGQYLASIHPNENEPYQKDLPRIRNRYTTRQMYVDEFEQIWEEQKKHNKKLTPELKETLGGRKKDGYAKDGIIFFQRPLRSQKYLIGNCPLEIKKTRCPASHPQFELYRALQFINGIECNGEKLSQSDKQKVLELLLRYAEPKFSKVRKILGKEDQGFHFNYQDDNICHGTYTTSQLSSKKLFGSKWFDFSEKKQDDIWHIFFSFDDAEYLAAYAKKHWAFDDEQIPALIKTWKNLDDDYSSLSRKAISNLLPFLKSGFTYDVAVALGGVKNAFGNHWDNLGDKNKEFIINKVVTLVRSATRGGFIDQLKEFLKTEFVFDETRFKKLYHHSVNIHASEIIPKLPVGKEADREIMSIRNPVVIQALFELRKLVNAIIDEHGSIDEIKIELGRDLKLNKEKRQEIRWEQTKLEAVNNYVIAQLREYGQRITHENILKYKLWEECAHRCPFTNKEIGVNQLFSGEVQIEHIFPWDRSLDDSYLNKTICFADENRKKGNRTPFEYFTQDFGADKWEEVKTRLIKIFYDNKTYDKNNPITYTPNRYRKYKRFIAEKFNDDFIQRQLNDTRYISREAKAYLQKVCEEVKVAPGALTANLRDKWGLNSILSDLDEKERTDHRHHAIDALVMACFNPAHLNEISKWNRYNRAYDLKDFPLPWKTFRDEAEKKVTRILISYKKSERVLTVRNTKTKRNGNVYINKGIAARGSLHRDFVYGKRTPTDYATAYHIRKPLESINTKTHVEKIADRIIRQLVERRIEEIGGYEGDKKDKVPKGTFFSFSDSGNRIPMIHLPNKQGNPVPVYKVRIRETIGNAEPLKENQNKYVNPRNNHHVLIFKDSNGNLKEDVVSFWTAVERKKQGQPLIQLPETDREGSIITTLQINDMFLLGIQEKNIDWNNTDNDFLSKYLHKVQKTAGGDYFMELCFRKHLDARTDKEAKADYVYIKNFGKGKTGWLTYNPIKVHLSPTGKISLIKESVRENSAP